MAIVRSFGTLQSMTPQPTWIAPTGTSINLYGLNQTYADIYKTQPNVRICVDFLARNIAQLGLPVYRRVSDTDRVRLADHDLANWLAHPNPSTTRYRLIESLMSDLGIYFNAYWLKVRYQDGDGRDAIGLVRLPPEEMEVKGGILPTHFTWTSNGREKDIPLSEVVYFNGYNPLNPLMGLSPLETLRRVLAEEHAAMLYREQFWSRGSRAEVALLRPKDAPKWNDTQRKEFRAGLQEFTGNGVKAGMIPVFEDGMTIAQTSFSAKDSEYTQGGKLRREFCAAMYHIPQPMVGILDHATFSNVKEQHKHLYQDCLGPWNEMIAQEIERQLLIECADQRMVYIEFNIDAKLAGTPEERAASLQMAVGRPWRTVNEARALENLPRIDDEELDTVAPQQGGPANSQAPATTEGDTTAVNLAPVIQATRARQQSRLAGVPVADRPAAFMANLDRWNRELSRDLAARTGAADEVPLAVALNAALLAQLEAEVPA